jgi:hypothetical protein
LRHKARPTSKSVAGITGMELGIPHDPILVRAGFGNAGCGNAGLGN